MLFVVPFKATLPSSATLRPYAVPVAEVVLMSTSPKVFLERSPVEAMPTASPEAEETSSEVLLVTDKIPSEFELEASVELASLRMP